MTAKDFFLHIAVIASLYTGAIALLNILFRVINVAFPQVDSYNYYSYGYYGSNPISFPVATLIVVFPLLLILTNVLRKSYAEDPARKEYAVRRWLIYITLFIAGGVLAGDLITVIYYFLDGRELTTGFILKILSVLVVIGSIFGYYMDDLKDRLTGSRQNMWRFVAAILVIGSIVAGFSVIGSPLSQRLMRYDAQRLSDLQSIQSQVLNYWQQKEVLPSNLQELNDSFSGFVVPIDPQTNTHYEYEKIDDLSFNLCAEFNKETTDTTNPKVRPYPYIDMVSPYGGSWGHPAGHHCFPFTIDPDLYPPTIMR